MELATSSVSSPGLEKYLNIDEATAQVFAPSIVALVDDLKYANIYDRGYMLLEFSQSEVTSQWIYVESILTQDASIKTASSKTAVIAVNQKTIDLS